MAHELYEIDGEDSMAYVGETPWHGLGQKLDPDDPLEVWAEKAHLNWGIEEGAAAFFDPADGLVQAIPNRKVLMRADTREYLSTVGTNYHPVQPIQVIEFFRSLIETGGFRMHTAGSMFNGRRMWALAEIGRSAAIKGQDVINGYLLLATACDGTLANTGQFTSVRVVCNNTLEMSLNNDRYVKLPHSRQFDPEEMKKELGLGNQAFDKFIEGANVLADRKVTMDEAVEFFINLYRTEEEIAEEAVDLDKPITNNVKNLIRLYEQEDLISADGTAWGIVNAVTRFYDHERGSTTIDHRLNNAWFGQGANFKKKAWDNALKLAA